ncbi:MAG: GNAT family acetyltransferase [Coprococcus sp.]
MVNRKELLALEFYKSRPFKGSDNGIRYMVQKIEKNVSDDENEKKEVLLKAYIWPEPFCFEVTADDLKQSQEFPFSEEGLCQAIEWINKNHDGVINKINPEDNKE